MILERDRLRAELAAERAARERAEKQRERLVGMLLVRADCYEDELPENAGENSWGACRNVEYMHGDWEWHPSRAEARAALLREDAPEAPKQGDILEAFEAIREAGGKDWDNIADPAAFLGREPE